MFKGGPAWWVKIGDFGISKRVEGSTALRTMQVGTRGYVAPEVIGIFCPDDTTTTAQDLTYTMAVDIWALGEITFRMITCQPSFTEPRFLYDYVVKKAAFPLQALTGSQASPGCCDLIQRMMKASPNDRIRVEGAWRHTWLQAHEFIDEEETSSDSKYIS